MKDPKDKGGPSSSVVQLNSRWLWTKEGIILNHTLCWGKGKTYYSFGSTPYGDVYIPQKITEYLKDYCGLYEMDIALQDVEGPPGKGPNSFRWTCVYLHNNGFSLE